MANIQLYFRIKLYFQIKLYSLFPDLTGFSPISHFCQHPFQKQKGGKIDFSIT